MKKSKIGKLHHDNKHSILLLLIIAVISISLSACKSPATNSQDQSGNTPFESINTTPTVYSTPSPSPTLTPTAIPTLTPTDEPVFEINGLVRLLDMDEKFVIDIKYATSDNFTGQKVYPVEIAVIHKETALKLIKANNRFREDGYKIKIWDAYRPVHVQQIFWDVYPDPKFVARPPSLDDPNPRPSHCNGMSVDITLVDENGIELEMPSEFDDFSDRASASYPYMSATARKNVDYLIEIMEEYGFKNYSGEWWHFNDITSTPIKYQDIPLEDFDQ